MRSKFRIFFASLPVVLFSVSSCHHESFAERSVREAKEYTERFCPHRVDSCTVMDSITYSADDASMHYWYALQRSLDNDSVFSEEFMDRFQQVLEEEVRGSIAKKEYKKRGTTFVHHYRSESTGREYFCLSVAPEDYN